MTANTRPTLRQVFAFSMLALMLGLFLLFYQVLKGWEQTILQSSERYRDLASREVAQRVTTYLNEAPMAVTQFEQQVKYGLIDTQNTDSVEQGLYSLLLANDNISDEDSSAHFAGVLRVWFLKAKIDDAVRLRITGQAEGDPHLIFLCDNQGRLITGWGNRDHVTVSGDDLRIAPGDVPPVVARAIQDPALKKDFTAFSETLTPDELAEDLGRYLQVMAEIIQSEKGTIDKYIGDSVMTFWNAPEAVTGHKILACRAALRCREALQELYDSSDWGHAPRFETRFGLHRCVASVGHFGAPDRLNYTAIGDGINLASRLEGLNKYYGTHIIASESIQTAAKGVFEFRILDRVAVKGKTEGILIYELLGERIEGKSRPEWVDRYEQAFTSYQTGDFATALELFEDQVEDSPSIVLASRCREWISHPPPGMWNGIRVFESK